MTHINNIGECDFFQSAQSGSYYDPIEYSKLKFLFLMQGKKSALSTYENLFFLPSLLVSLHHLSPCSSQCV